MSRKPITVALAIAAIVAAAPAAAQSNFYIAGSVGYSSIDANGTDIDATNLRNGFTSSITSVSGNDTAGKINLGYRVGNVLSFEFGYTYLGEATFTSTTNLSTVSGRVKGDLWGVDAVGLWPMTSNLGFLGRFGIYRWETRSDIPALSGGTMSATDNGWDFKLGAGLQYDVSRNFALRAEFERFNGIGDNHTTGDSKVNLISAGAVLKF